MRTCGIDNNKDMLLNGAIGLCGETGEVADLIKKPRVTIREVINSYEENKQKILTSFEHSIKK